MEEIVYELALGLCCFSLALLFPHRRMPGRPEWGWDCLNFLGVLLFLGVYSRYFDEPLSAAVEAIDAFGDWQTQFFTPISPLATAFLYFVVADFGVYWTHRALHSHWLWDQHAWHHAPRYIYFGSGMRGTVIHGFFTAIPYSVAALIVPVFAYDYLIIYILVFDILNQHYLHSNIRVPGARWLEKIVVTPRMHIVHHHANPLRTNSNYGFTFSVWDRLFGTFTDPDTVSDEALGLDYEASNWKMAIGLPARNKKEVSIDESGDGSSSVAK